MPEIKVLLSDDEDKRVQELIEQCDRMAEGDVLLTAFLAKLDAALGKPDEASEGGE